MKRRMRIVWVVSAVVFFAAVLAVPLIALADKGSVMITAPNTAKKGEEITIEVMAMHCCNHAMHHINWVYLDINGKEVKRWEYSAKDLPPSNNFTVTYKYKVEGPTELKAEASCNLHGSAGPVTAAVQLE